VQSCVRKRGFLVVGECADGYEVLDAVRRQRPEVVVMDVRMPRMNGADATHQLRERVSEPPAVLILTTFQDEEVLSSALRAGASGFLLKDAPGEEILRAVRTLASGGAYLDPAVTGRVLATYRQTASRSMTLTAQHSAAVQSREPPRLDIAALRH
jgi:DNA-binding NarL/FixJ family response regulator